MPVIYKKLAWLEREELIKHFVSVEFNRFLQYYQNAKDINVDESRHSDKDFEREGKRRDRSKKDRKRSGFEFTRFFFNLGKKNGIDKRKIIDLINQHLPGQSVEIGDIEVLKGFSFFEVDARYEKQVTKAFKNARYKGQRIGIDVVKRNKTVVLKN